jgi:hypothetical protein
VIIDNCQNFALYWKGDREARCPGKKICQQQEGKEAKVKACHSHAFVERSRDQTVTLWRQSSFPRNGTPKNKEQPF